MKHKDLDLKIQNCTNAYKSYQHLLNEIKNMMRSGDFNSSHIYNTMRNIDYYVTDNSQVVDKYLSKYETDNSPVVDKYLSKYDEKFTH